MVRKFIVCASLAGLMLLSGSGRAYSAPKQSQDNQQSADAQTVSGKVAAIGSDHKSFSLEVNGGNTMQFLLDNNTQVQGRVTTGTTATVQYQKTDDGKLLALSIAPQNPGQSPQ
jgi:outer membrane murein-binding lipoprotein Lpp